VSHRIRSFARYALLTAALICLAAGSAAAGTLDPSPTLFSNRSSHDPWRVEWLQSRVADAPIAARLDAPAPILLEQDAAAQPLHAVAIQHSQGYQTRAKIHKYASFATLPLFAVEIALGQSLYSGSTEPGWKKGAHGLVGAGIVGLFGVNTLTGAWNLFGEGWSDKDGRTLRLLHGLLMMASDVGILATTMSGPHSQGRRALTFTTDRATHRDLALASISVGTVGYLIMLIGNH
jgi:hypothetical protein